MKKGMNNNHVLSRGRHTQKPIYASAVVVRTRHIACEDRELSKLKF